jgi:hypothetical protein
MMHIVYVAVSISSWKRDRLHTSSSMKLMIQKSFLCLILPATLVPSILPNDFLGGRSRLIHACMHVKTFKWYSIFSNNTKNIHANIMHIYLRSRIGILGVSGSLHIQLGNQFSF